MTAKFVIALLVSIAPQTAAEKPTVYNNVQGSASAIDALVKAAFEPTCTIVDITDPAGYVPAKPTAGRRPCLAKSPEGEPIGGDVLLAYVISTEGRAVAPVVLESADPRLDALAIGAMAEWRFEPATLEGVAIATLAAQQFSFETTPTEFVTQALEPLDGKVLRPKSWFYVENHRGPTCIWTISREDSAGGKPYTTGVRIQLLTGIKEGAGKSARQFILDFVEAKKQDERTKVIKTCDAEDQGLFTRMCLETEEGQDHILYSLFWGSGGLDMAVVMVAGTTKELWDTYSPVFDKMGEVELIGQEHLKMKK